MMVSGAFSSHKQRVGSIPLQFVVLRMSVMTNSSFGVSLLGFDSFIPKTWCDRWFISYKEKFKGHHLCAVSLL